MLGNCQRKLWYLKVGCSFVIPYRFNPFQCSRQNSSETSYLWVAETSTEYCVFVCIELYMVYDNLVFQIFLEYQKYGVVIQKTRELSSLYSYVENVKFVCCILSLIYKFNVIRAKDSTLSPQHSSKAVIHFVVLILFCTIQMWGCKLRSWFSLWLRPRDKKEVVRLTFIFVTLMCKISCNLPFYLNVTFCHVFVISVLML